MNRFVETNEITSKNLLDLERALSHEDDSAIILNIQTNQILLANTLACKTLGYLKNEIIDSDLSNIISTSFSPIKIQNPKDGKKTSRELCQFITKSGFSFIAERKNREIKIDNQNYQLICLYYLDLMTLKIYFYL